MPSRKRWGVAICSALYLYLLLPATAVLFYELYHLIEFDIFYWAYSGFKFAGYYFGQWPYSVHTCLGVAVLILFSPLFFRRKKVEENAVEDSGQIPTGRGS